MITSITPSIPRRRTLRRSFGRKFRWSAMALMLAAVGRLDAAPPELKTQGNQIVVKSTGEPVRLVGVNLGNLENNLPNLNLIASMEVGVGTWKANVFRLPVKHTYWLGSSTSAAYIAQIDEVIAKANELDVYVILDLHDYTRTKFVHEDFWTEAANRYKNNPAVLFGLLNEPHGISWDVWLNGDSQGNGMQALLDTVRATGANNIVLAGGTDWGYSLTKILEGYALVDTPSGNGVVYDSHVYPWKSYIQEHVGNIALTHPVLLGEFGHPGGTTYPNQSSFEHHSTWVPRMMDWINTNNLHWTGWCFHDISSPRMLVDWSYEPTDYWGAYARAHMQSYADPNALRVVGGTIIGSPGTKSAPTSGVITHHKDGAVVPFSNTINWYYKAATPSDGWTGLDLGKPTRITQIKFIPAPISNGPTRMVGGVFEGSNTADFSSGVVTLHTIASTPSAHPTFTTVPISNTGTYRYVRYKGPANSDCNVAAIRFYTGDDSGPGVNDDVIIIDNGGTGSTVVGNWTNASNHGFHGSRWVHDDNDKTTVKEIHYTPTIMQAGEYEVFARWSTHASREENVPYTITYAGGSTTVYRNQKYDNATWVSLGTYPFGAGTGNKVVISNENTTNYVVADAIKFVHRAATAPSGWTNGDIGSVGVAGSYVHSGGVHTVSGSGSTIGSTADSFHFVYQTISGDCTITAKVNSQTNTHGYARAGVMIRDGLAANAKYALAAVTPSNGAYLLYRTTAGGGSSNGSGAGVAPYWVRVKRVGNTISGYRSADGVTWTQISTNKTISMSSSVQVGLAVCSYNNSTLGTATFSDVTISTP